VITAFVGDIHGCVPELRSVIYAAAQHAEHFVFLGDYVDRGPSSRLVIDELLAFRERFPNQVTFLRGNHDAAFLDVLTADDGLDTFLKMGGAKTIRSYIDAPYNDALKRLRQAVPEAHRDFLSSLERSYNASDVVAVHDPDDAPADGRFVVAGHKTQSALEPHIGEAAAYIDTGCGTREGGRLTCLLWPSLEWWQSELDAIDG
jgi:serine/threonine protein phosphatase 1